MKNSFCIPRQGSSSSIFLAAGCLLLVVVPIAGYSSTGYLLLGTNAFDPPGTKAVDPPRFNAAIASVEKLGKLKVP